MAKKKKAEIELPDDVDSLDAALDDALAGLSSANERVLNLLEQVNETGLPPINQNFEEHEDADDPKRGADDRE